MRKLNNKGFAISTLIYGLAIMAIMIVAILMATMSQTRSNTTSLVKSIEQDLNRFSRTETTFKPVGNDIQSQEYIVPTSGWYRIELWGTQGGGNGGRGAYTSGIIELNEGEVIYFYVGKHKSSGGGTASEVRVRAGAYDDDISYETRIMSAAGGGSAATAWGGTLYGYDANMNSYGGYIRSQSSSSFALYETSSSNPTNGTLVGFNKTYAVSSGTNPKASASNEYLPSVKGSNGGGDGHFPSNSSSTGGASYIAGYAGCYGITKGKNTNSAIMNYYERIYVEEETNVVRTYKTEKTGTYYFVDGIMMPGVNDGDGFAKIERVAEKTDTTTKLKIKNEKFKNIKMIKYCNNGDTSTVKITASSKGGTYINSIENSSACKTQEYANPIAQVDEIAIFHTTSGKDYKDAKITVSTDGSTWTTIRDLGNETLLSETETVTGYRASAYQYDATTTLPSRGNYIIQPVLSENKVVSAASSAETNSDPISIDYYKGEKRQIWSIELITDKKISPGYIEGNPTTYEYKIIESARYKALAITQDENLIYNRLSAMEKFNDKARNVPQIWKITPVGNGTYTIRTAVSGSGRGNLIAQTNVNISDALNQIIIGKDNKDTARFKLIQVDYSSN